MAVEPQDMVASRMLRGGSTLASGSASAGAAPPARVMLLDLNWKQTPYLAAALASSGIATTLVTTLRPDHLGLGHYCTQIQGPAPHSPDYVPFVRQQIGLTRPDVVIPLCEPIMELLWDLNPPLEAPIYPPMTEQLRSILRDRRRFYQRATAMGIPVPPWMPIAKPSDLEEAARRFGYPLVLRGTRGLAGSQVRVVRFAQEAPAALDQLNKESPGQPFAQAFIRGPRHLVGGFFSRGETIRVFAQETIDQYPAVTGPSIRVRACADTTLIGSARALIADLGWSGMACVEFIRDESGRFVLMEMNPRPWAALEVAERRGADICRAFAESLTGKPVGPQQGYRVGGSDIVLEGFVLARSPGTGLWPTLRTLKLRDWFACARAVPWGRPWLAFHVLRRLYRELA